MFGKKQKGNIATVIESLKVEEVKPVEVPSKLKDSYRIIEGELLDSGIFRYTIVSSCSLGEIGQEFEVD